MTSSVAPAQAGAAAWQLARRPNAKVPASAGTTGI
jgi:hypothetical protein